jgi:hypothetical protein
MSTTNPATTANAELNPRQRAMLRAVAGGRSHITCSSEPDLYVDGLPCCDQHSARYLVRTGLICPLASVGIGQLVAAGITASGRDALGA